MRLHAPSESRIIISHPVENVKTWNAFKNILSLFIGLKECEKASLFKINGLSGIHK